MSESFKIITKVGKEVKAWIPYLAELRIQVFREYPYLYAGTLEDEEHYLEAFSKSSASCVVLCLAEQDRVVGVSTGILASQAGEMYTKVFRLRGMNLEEIFYFGESVLLPDCRNQGIGHKFFHAREAFARSLPSVRQILFCGVVRPPHDEKKPKSYKGPEGLWKKHGYAPVAGLTTTYHWQELESEGQLAHEMQFWAKDLKPSL